MQRYILAAVVALITFFPPSYAGAVRQASETGPEVGRYAPPISLTDLFGSSVSLESLRGQVVLLNFWSSLCSPCKAEMPSMNRLSEALREKGLQVVSVAIDTSDMPVREYAAKNSIGYTILLDKDKGVFSEEYSAPGLPATYLIDRKGIIVEKFTGLQVWDAPDMQHRVILLLTK